MRAVLMDDRLTSSPKSRPLCLDGYPVNIKIQNVCHWFNRTQSECKKCVDVLTVNPSLLIGRTAILLLHI